MRGILDRANLRPRQDCYGRGGLIDGAAAMRPKTLPEAAPLCPSSGHVCGCQPRPDRQLCERSGVLASWGWDQENGPCPLVTSSSPTGTCPPRTMEFDMSLRRH